MRIVKNLLLSIDYPISFIQKYARKRLRHIMYSDSNSYIVVPYIRGLYERTSWFLKRIFDIRVIPKNYRSLSNLIVRGKDKTLKTKKNAVVYKLSCKDCDASYIGETKRPVAVRIKEHTRKVGSVISDHCLEANHMFDFDRFHILDEEKDLRKRLISEMVHIKMQSNALNKQEDTRNLSVVYDSFIHNFQVSRRST